MFYRRFENWQKANAYDMMFLNFSFVFLKKDFAFFSAMLGRRENSKENPALKHTITSCGYSATIDDQGARIIDLSLPDTQFIISDCAASELPSTFLFPFYGALSAAVHPSIGGTKMPVGPWGLLGDYSFVVSRKTDDDITLTLRSDLQTRQRYPFDFLYAVTFQMVGPRLAVTVRVENHTQRAMPFMSGLAFCVRLPFDPGLAKEDYDVDFLYDVHPHQIRLHNGLPGRVEPYELLYDHKLRLDSSLPRGEIILLNGLPSGFSLLSHKGQRTLKFACPALPYRSFWVSDTPEGGKLHCMLTPALPPSSGNTNDVSALHGITTLASEETWQADYSISIS